MQIGRWDQYILEACATLRILPHRVLQAASKADDPEGVIAAQLRKKEMEQVRKEACKRVPPAVADALKDPARNFGRLVVIHEIRALQRGSLHEGWDKKTGDQIWVLRAPRREDRLRVASQAAMTLKHHTIADIRSVEMGDSGLAIGLERPPGTPIERENRSQSFVLPIIRDIAVATAHANEKGIMHLTLDPEKIFISSAGDPVVFGFGLDRALDEVSAYSAPEQLRRNPDRLGPRTEVYRIAASLYGLLAHRPPFDQKGAVAVKRAIAASPPPRLREVMPTVPREIENVVMKCLQRDPKERYRDCRYMADELNRILASQPVNAVTFTKRMARRQRVKSRRLLLGLIAVLFLVLTFCVTFYSGRGPQEIRTADPVVLEAADHFLLGDYTRAREAAVAAVDANPNDPLARYWKLRCDLHSELARRRLPHPYRLNGALLWDASAVSTPRAGLRVESEALQGVIPKSAAVSLTALSLLLSRKDEAAIPVLEEALSLSPDDHELRIQLAHAFYRQRRFADAAQFAQPALDGPLEAQARAVSALSLLGTAVDHEVSSLADPIEEGLRIAGTPDHPAVASAIISLLSCKAGQLETRGSFFEARKELRRALEIADTHELNALVRARKAEVITRLAAHHELQGRPGRATELHEEARLQFAAAGMSLTQDPGFALRWCAALLARTRALIEHGDRKQALRQADLALQKLYLSKELRTHLHARVLHAELTGIRKSLTGQEGAFRSAVNALDTLLSSAPGFGPALSTRARIRMRLAADRPDLAPALIEKVLADLDMLSETDSDPRIACDRARAFRILGMSPEGGPSDILKALELLNGVLERHPTFVRGLQERADTFGVLGLRGLHQRQNPSGCVTLLNLDTEKVLEIDETLIQPRLLRARSLLRLCRGAETTQQLNAWLQRAIRDCNAVVANGMDNVEALTLRGQAYLLNAMSELSDGDPYSSLQQALQDFNRAVEGRPGERRLHGLRGAAHLQMGLTLSGLGQDGSLDFERAEAELIQALNGDASIHRDLGIARHRLGKFGKALESLEEAVRLDARMLEAAEDLMQECRRRSEAND